MHDDVDVIDEYMAKIRKMVAERDALRDERDDAKAAHKAIIDLWNRTCQSLGVHNNEFDVQNKLNAMKARAADVDHWKARVEGLEVERDALKAEVTALLNLEGEPVTSTQEAIDQIAHSLNIPMGIALQTLLNTIKARQRTQPGAKIIKWACELVKAWNAGQCSAEGSGLRPLLEVEMQRSVKEVRQKQLAIHLYDAVQEYLGKMPVAPDPTKYTEGCPDPVGPTGPSSFGPPKGWEPFTSNPTEWVERDLTKEEGDHGKD